MPKFYVEVCKTTHVTTTIEIETVGPKKAVKLAKEIVAEKGKQLKWTTQQCPVLFVARRTKLEDLEAAE